MGPRHLADTSGRLTAVMLRALAAELSDPGRFSRAKAYARDGAVVDLEVDAGEVRAMIMGSRFDPYIASLLVEPAGDVAAPLDLVPDRDEVWAECSCPDEGPYGFCKHALATLLELADEVALDPAVLVRWRAGSPADQADARSRQPVGEPAVDVLAAALSAPTPLPELPRLPTRLPVAIGPGDELAAEVLADALATLRSG